MVDRCPESMVIVANKHIFGGGQYSSAGSRNLRIVGRRKRSIVEISVAPAPGGVRDERGRLRRPHVAPYLPTHFTQPFHPGGNSACYTIQTAHLMGCNPIVLLGFTLASGSGYFFGRQNPVTRRASIYDQGRALDWLAWYRAAFPGRVLLWPGWEGPIYDVLEVADESQFRPRHESDAHGRDAAAVE